MTGSTMDQIKTRETGGEIDPRKRLMRPDEALELLAGYGLRLHKITLMRYIAEGAINSRKIGGRRYLTIGDVEQFVEGA